MNAVKKAALLLSTVLAVAVCTGCHGARGLAPFEMPEAFDTAKEQEITFGQRMIPIKRRRRSMRRRSRRLRSCIPISTSTFACIRTTGRSTTM